MFIGGNALELVYISVYLLVYLILLILLHLFSCKDKRVILIYNYLFFTIHAILALICYYFNILPNTPDATLFHETGKEIVAQLKSFNTVGNISMAESAEGARLYTYFIIVPIYLIFFEYAPLVVLLNLFILTLAIMLLARVAFTMYPKKGIQSVVYILAMLYPALTVYNLVLIRDAFAILGLAIFIYSLTNLYKRQFKFIYVLQMLLGIVLIIGLRPQNAPVTLFIIIIYFLRNKKIKVSYKAFSIGLLAGILLILSQSSYLRFLGSINPHYLSAYRRSQIAYLPDVYLPNLDYSSWIDVALNVPVLFFYYIFSPFPWVSGNYNHLLAVVDSIFCIGLIIFTIVGYCVGRSENKNIKRILMLFIVMSITAYSLVEVYFGGAVRHRIQQLILVIPFAANGLVYIYYKLFKVKG